MSNNYYLDRNRKNMRKLDELLTEEEYKEAVTWLKKYQHLTKDYQEMEIEL